MATLPEVLPDAVPNYYQGDISDLDQNYVKGKLGEVVDQINVRWGAIVAARLASGALPTRLYEAVVVRVASRVFENPEGYRKENEGQYGYEVNPAVASGTLWYTADDIKDLTGASADGTSVIGTASVGLHRPRW